MMFRLFLLGIMEEDRGYSAFYKYLKKNQNGRFFR